MAGKERVRAPLGNAVIVADGRRVRELHLRRGRTSGRASGALADDLRRYFAGERVDFRRYDVDLAPCTAFERTVYEATRKIPYGETRTYGEIAVAIGKPGAARAVGQALGKNPACIVIPCHRVVASNGLGGFTGGLAWKEALLRLEGLDV